MNLSEFEKKFFEDISGASSQEDVNALRVQYLGKKSEILNQLKSLNSLTVEEKKEKGKALNEIKTKIENAISERQKEISLAKSDISFDYSAPGDKQVVGHAHLLSQVSEELFNIARSLGFSISTGPEIETDWYNFEALNIPRDHPARDTQDSFYIDENTVLRTHTSPVQIRYMETHKPPIRVVVWGRVYRRDSDVTHTPMFHQLEGLLVDENVKFSDLKGVLTVFVQELFGKDRKLRFRPHHFPFTEPSAEVDVSCGLCGGKGCRSCKYSGWLEILGAGMVHPNVLENAGIDSKKYQGFAFGMGIERIAMLKYDIDDIRLFYENDFEFLEQF